MNSFINVIFFREETKKQNDKKGMVIHETLKGLDEIYYCQGIFGQRYGQLYVPS